MARKSYDEIVSETRKRNYYNRANKKDKSYEDIKRDQRDFRQFGPIEPTITTPAPTVSAPKPTVTTRSSHSGGTHGGRGGTFTQTKSDEALKREAQGRRWAEAHPAHDRTATTTATPTTETGIRARANATAERERRLAEINAAQRERESKPDWRESLSRVASALSGNATTPTKNEPLSLAEKYRQDYGLTQEQYEREKAEYDAKVRARSQQALENTYSKLDKRGKDLLKDYDEGTGFRQGVMNAATAIAKNMTGNEVGTTADYNSKYEKAQQAKKALRDEYGLTDDQITQLSVRAKRERDSIESNKDKVTADAQNYARQHPVRASLTSLGTNVVGNIAGGLGTLENMLDNAAMYNSGYEGGSEFEENNPYYAPTRRTQAIRDTVANEKINNRVGSFIYQTAMSGADSAIAALIGAALPAGSIGKLSLSAGGTMLGMGAATSTMLDLADKGADYGTSVMGGLVSGAFEMLFEDISISQLSTFKNVEEAAFKKGISKAVVKDSVKLLAKKLGATTFTNATEEGFTEIANLIYDTAANDGYSQYAEYYNDALKNGASPDEAKKIAIENMTMQVLEAAAGGALMGLMFGMGGAAKLGVNYRQQYKGAQRLGGMISADSGRADVINTAEAMPEGSESRELLNKYQNSKKGLTSNRIGRLAVANEEFLMGADEDTINKVEAARRDVIQTKAGEAQRNFDRFELNNAVVGTDKSGKAIRMVDANANNKGAPAKIFSKGANGALTFKTSDGKTQVLNKQSVNNIQNADTRELAKFALDNKLGAEGANLLFDTYNPETLTDDHEAAFLRVYRQGALGTSSKALFGSYGDDMRQFTADQQQKITAAGLAEKETKPGATDWRVYTKNDGFVSLQIKAMDTINKALKREIYVVDDLYETYTAKDENGNDVKRMRYLNGQYLKDSGKIILSANADKGLLLSFLGHEMGHEMKVNDRAIYDRLVSEVKSHYTGDEWDKQIKKFVDMGYDESDVEEEIVCNSLFDVFDRKTISKIFGKDKAAAVRAYKTLARISSLYNNAISEYANTLDNKGEYKHGDIKKLRESGEFVDKTRELFSEYLGNYAAGEYEGVKNNEAVKNSISDRDAEYSNIGEQINELRKEQRELNDKISAYKNTDEYKALMAELEKPDVDAVDIASKLEALEKEKGITGVSKRNNEIQLELLSLRRQQENIENQLNEAARKKAADMSSSEAEQYVKKAKQIFGTTSNFNLAGYLATDGSLIKLSETGRSRDTDHRAVAQALDFLPDTHGYSDGLIAFENMGNIRLQSYGAELVKAPTQAQETALKRLARKLDGEITIDVADENGYNLWSIEYPEGTSADRVINDIREYFDNGKIPEISETALYHNSISDRKDTEYVKALEKFGEDSEQVADMVEQAAEDAGYNSPNLWHGTQRFGFTKFDLSKMDDRSSIFLTTEPGMAESYSGVGGTRKIADSVGKTIDNLSSNELVDFANNMLDDYDSKYSYVSKQQIDDLINNYRGSVNRLQDMARSAIKEIKNGINDSNRKIGQVNISNLDYFIKQLDRKVPDLVLRTYTNAIFKQYLNSEQYSDFSKVLNDLQFTQALYEDTEKLDKNGGAIRQYNGLISENEIREKIKEKAGKGNYALKAKLGKSLVIDAKGANWNEVPFNVNQLGDISQYDYIKYGDNYALIDEETGEVLTNRLYTTDTNKWLYSPSVKKLREIYKEAGEWNHDSILKALYTMATDEDAALKDFNTARTRDIAKWAREHNYDSVVLKNLYDDGGRSHKPVPMADVYIIFDPNSVKSLDPVTYDNEGNIIPLSERFNAKTDDIRYSISDRDTKYMQAVESGNEAEQQKLVDEAAEAAMPNSKVRDENGKLLKVFHGRVSEFNVFDRSYGNAEGDFGRAFYFTNNEDDVEANYANEEGPDLTNKIEHFRDIMDSSEDEEYNALSYEEKDKYIKDNLITAEPNIVEAYVNIQNPVYIAPNSEGTYFDFDYGYDEETDEYDEPSGLLVDFVEALQEAAQDYWYGGRESPDFSFLYEYGDGMYAADAVGMIKHKSDNLYDIMTEDGDLALNEVIRSAFEIMGYDGIIDSSVPYKFSRMTGMNRDTVHYLAFDSSQIKRADAVTYDDNGNVIPLSERFNPESDDIRRSLSDRGDVAEYEAEQYLENASAEEIKAIVDEVDRRLQNVPYFEDKQEQAEVYAILDKMREKRDRLYEALSMDTGNESLAEYNRNTRNEMFGEAEPEGTIEGNKLIGKGQRQNIKKADAEKLIKRYKNVHHDRGTPLSLENLDEATAKLQQFYEDMQNNPNMAWDEVYDKAKDVAVEVIKFTKRHKEVHHPGKIYQQTYNTRYYNPFNDYTDDTGRNYGREAISDSFVLKPGAEEWLAPIINDIVTDYFDVPVSNSDAVKTANLKTTYKNQIQSLKNQIRAIQKEHRAEVKQKVKAQKLADDIYYQKRIKEIRADRDQKLLAQRIAYQRLQQNRREQKAQRDLKGKIYRRYQRLDQELRKPNGNRYVPKDLVNTVAGVLSQITETLQTEEYYNTGRVIKSHVAQNKKLAELKVVYDAMQGNEQYSSYYDPVISEMMQAVADNTKGKTINDMNVSELQQVYNLMTALDHTVRNAAKVEIAGKEHDAFKIADKSIDQLKEVKAKKINRFTKYWYDQMNARSFFRQLSGYTEGGWMDMNDILNEGQLKQSAIKAEVTETFRELTSDKQARDLMDTKKLYDVGLKDAAGKPIKLTKGMVLAIYMHLQNEQNVRHIAEGGLTVPDLEKYYKGDREAYGTDVTYSSGVAGELRQLNMQINELEKNRTDANAAETDAKIEALEAKKEAAYEKADALMDNLRMQIEKQLTDYDRAWIDKAKWFFDEYSKDKLNEATMQMYGFTKANENNYFPIKVDRDMIAPNFEGLKRDMTLEASGFMKDRQKGAANAIYLEDMVDVIRRQMDNVAAYSGLAPAIKNFNKVYGKSKADDQGNIATVTSVQKAVNSAFGQYGKKYIADLLTDLQGGRKSEPSIISDLRGNAYQAALTLNLRVAMAQAGSYPTAAAEIGWKPLMKALRHGGEKNTVLSKADRELIAKYTPLLANRVNGGNATVDLNNLKTLSAHSRQGVNARILQKTAAATDWISKVDAATVGRLWYAAQYYVDDNSKLEKGTDEYYKEVAKVFNRIVERTQPSYTTMQRSALLRNPNEAVKLFTMYMTQRGQNYNLLYDSIMEYKTLRDGAKNGAVSKDKLNKSAVNLRRTVSSQLAAGLTLSAMKIVADAIQHNMKGYRDDDDDEVKAGKILEKLGTTWLESELSNVFLGSEIYSFADRCITGEPYYGISVNVVGAAEDFAKDLKNMVSSPSAKSVDRVFRDAATIMGIPASQMNKFANMGKYWFEDIKDGGGIYSNYEGNETNKQMAGKMVAAYLRGDMAQYRTRSEALGGKSDSSVKSAITSYVEEKVLSGDMSETEARRVFINVYGKSEKETDKKLEEIRQKKAGTYEKKESKKWGG